MRHNNKKGYVIELMIFFMLVTFGFCMIITTFVSSLTTERKYAKNEITRQSELNQIGEYYLRAIEAGGSFPKGNETNYSAFTWMDDNKDGKSDDKDEAVQFFKKYKNYSYSDKISTEYGDFKSFYEKLSVKRRLVVSLNEKPQMVIIIEEKYVNNNSTTYDILSWSIGDDLTVTEDGFTQDVSLNILQKLWRFFGLVKNGFSGMRLTDLSDLAGFFGSIDDNWRSAFG